MLFDSSSNFYRLRTFLTGPAPALTPIADVFIEPFFECFMNDLELEETLVVLLLLKVILFLVFPALVLELRAAPWL
jgi:hypothetical protein